MTIDEIAARVIELTEKARARERERIAFEKSRHHASDSSMQLQSPKVCGRRWRD